MGSAEGGLARSLFALWAAAIAASTLLIHEHHVVDVLAGALLAWGMWRAVKPRASSESFLAALRLEALCARELWRFSCRHPRYLLIALGLYASALPHWSATRRARTGFCFLQLVDDVLDGDRPLEGEPLEWVDRLLVHLETGGGGDEDVALVLGRAFLAQLDDVGARMEALQLVRTMRRDRERVREGRELSTEALRAHHRDTFVRSVGLMLHVARAEVRAPEAPSLLEAFGWCSTMRDLEEDLDKGLFNVPQEVNQAVRAEGREPTRYASLVGSVAGRMWLVAEHHRARALLDASREELDRLGDRSGVRLLRLFHRSIEGFWARRLPRRLPLLREAVDLSSRPSGARARGRG